VVHSHEIIFRFSQNKFEEGTMKERKVLRALVLALAMSFTLGLGYSEAAEYCPDNFVFLIDQSGSMYMHFAERPQFGPDPLKKMTAAKQLAMDINSMIPQANYNAAPWTAALQLFAPVNDPYAAGAYDRARMAKAVESIKDSQPIFDRLTPMGPGIMALDPVLGQMRGNTAVVLLSDGMANLGPDPVGEARAIYSKYPSTCIHIISLADKTDKRGMEILAEIKKLNNCSIMAEGLTLLADKGALEKFVRDVFCAPRKDMPKEEVFILRGIQFDFDKYDIKPEYRVILDEAVDALKKRPEIKVVIEGHTDSIGSAAYNQKLSERRAGAVFDYFVQKGIKSSRLDSVGYGKERPKAANTKPDGSDNPEGRAINRRVELKVVR
jgi:OOP family OmpA-OmpF porin